MRTLKDSLSHLSFIQACKLLGPRGKSLIMQGGRFDINLADQVSLEQNRFRLTLGNVRVDISLNSGNLVGGSRELPPPNRTARTGQVSRSSIND